MLDKACRKAHRANLARMTLAVLVGAVIGVFLLHIGFRAGSSAPVKTDVPAPVKHSLSKWV